MARHWIVCSTIIIGEGSWRRAIAPAYCSCFFLGSDEVSTLLRRWKCSYRRHAMMLEEPLVELQSKGEPIVEPAGLVHSIPSCFRNITFNALEYM